MVNLINFLKKNFVSFSCKIISGSGLLLTGSVRYLRISFSSCEFRFRNFKISSIACLKTTDFKRVNNCGYTATIVWIDNMRFVYPSLGHFLISPTENLTKLVDSIIYRMSITLFDGVMSFVTFNLKVNISNSRTSNMVWIMPIKLENIFHLFWFLLASHITFYDHLGPRDRNDIHRLLFLRLFARWTVNYYLFSFLVF